MKPTYERMTNREYYWRCVRVLVGYRASGSSLSLLGWCVALGLAGSVSVAAVWVVMRFTR